VNGLSELVPPFMVILGMYFTDRLFSPQRYVIPLVEDHIADCATPEGKDNLAHDFESLALGWQAIVDLTYSFIASIGLMISRLVDGKLQTGWLVTLGVFVLMICNLLLFGWACQLGPTAIVSEPFWPRASETGGVRRRRITLQRVATKFVFYSNIMLLVLMIVERALDKVLHLTAHLR